MSQAAKILICAQKLFFVHELSVSLQGNEAAKCASSESTCNHSCQHLLHTAKLTPQLRESFTNKVCIKILTELNSAIYCDIHQILF